MRILAADDQPIILKSIQRKLEEAGFRVDAAKDGQEAIQLFQTNRPDLVILDLNMPVKNGFDVIDHIKSSSYPNTPVIVMTGLDDESTILKAFYEGIDDYIEKPVSLNEVVARVKRLLKVSLSIEEVTPCEQKKSGILQKNGIGVVIPCYNEETRLKTQQFSDFIHNNYGYVLCFVNDGSTDNTLYVLKEFKKEREDSIIVYNCEKNGGKAEAVRLGVQHLLADVSLDYIGYLDADLSTNFADFEDLARTISSSDYKLVAGSRISRAGANIVRNSSRGSISRLINGVIRRIIGMEFQDTQCGAKIMCREVAQNLFNEPFLTRWLFDIEIIMRMKKYYGPDKTQSLIYEQPLKRWVHEDGSKLSMKDSLRIIEQLYQINKYY